jgi:hypothetical protein
MALSAQEAMNANRDSSPKKYSYPQNRNIDNLKHYMIMNFLTFSFRVDPNLTTNSGALGRSLITIPNFFGPSRPTASIKLPVPMKIIEKYGAEYSASNNTAEVLSIITKFIPERLLSRFNAATGVASIGANLSGVSLNPYTTIKFKGIPLRTHSFVWKFSPESEADTNEIESIIKAIRLRMHPTGTFSSLTNFILSYPELVNFRIFGAENPDHIFPTAPCVVNSFNIDRTGGDYPSFFETTGMPVVYQIYMSVIEILPLLRSSDDELRTSSPIQS